MKPFKFILLLFLSVIVVSIIIISCKKVDVERLAVVTTGDPSNVQQTSVTAYGSIIDLGEDEKIQEYGFCLNIINPDTIIPPTLDDKATPPFDPTDITGDFLSNISGLVQNSNYQMRAYVVEPSGKVTYGNTIQFTTQSSGGSAQWLHYDDGINDDGIGLTEGGSFDVAIRFPTQALYSYNGYKISKIKFFPREGTSTQYSITIWEGTDIPTLLHDELVNNPQINNWTEFAPSYIYTINSNQEFWVGIWVQNHPPATYPAGVDAGPAVAGAGDMFSTDDGDTWDPLSELYPELDYNWNLQVYITNDKGQEVQLVNNVSERKLESTTTNGSKEVKSEKVNEKLID